jgi:hypothetical protein
MIGAFVTDHFSAHQLARFASQDRTEQMALDWFYEIRSPDNTVLKRTSGFPTLDAAKIAGREDAKRMRNMRQPDVGRIMVGQNGEKATRY